MKLSEVVKVVLSLGVLVIEIYGLFVFFNSGAFKQLQVVKLSVYAYICAAIIVILVVFILVVQIAMVISFFITNKKGGFLNKMGIGLD